MTVLKSIPHPGITVGGKTAGPAVSLGRCRVGRGMPLYLHMSEAREIVRQFGWPLPETHAKIVEELAEVRGRVAELEQQVADQAQAVAAAEEALRARFGGDQKPATVVKHPRKHVDAKTAADEPKAAA